ncbi:MAG: hypothetical protein V4568_12010 [Pseudomonadota bacterium]
MVAKYILSIGAVVLLVLAIIRIVKDGGRVVPQSKTWLVMAGIMTAVSIWLWTGGGT